MVPDINDEQVGDYWLHHLSRPPVFDGLVKTLFPNVDIERFQDGEHTPDGEEADTDMDAPDQAIDRMHDMNDRQRSFDRQSALTTLLTSHMPVLKYDPVIGSLVEYDPSDTVDVTALQEILTQAAQGAFYEGGDPVDVFEKRLLEIAANFKNSRHADIARTFHARFLDKTANEFVDASGLRVRSYRNVISNAQRLITAATDENEVKAVIGRVDMAHRVTKNVVRTFLEAVRVNKAKGRYRSSDAEVGDNGKLEFPIGRLTMELFDNTTQEDVVQDIKARTNSMFMASGGSAVKVAPGVRDRFHVGLRSDPKPAQISIFPDTVRFGEDVLVSIKSNGSQDTYELVTKQPEMIQQFFSAAGFPLMANK